jgi:hypothetical protein
MKRTSLVVLALLAVAVAVVAGAAVAVNGPKKVEFTFTGRLLADPASNATSLAVDVKTGNRLALQKLVGQSRNQTFAVDADTEYLVWTQGKPSVVSIDSLSAGDLVTIHIRAARDSSLLQVETTPASIVADRGLNPGRPHQALWLFRGTLNGPATTSTLTLHVLDGNHRALRSMLGAAVDETFTYDSHTVFVLWQGRVPTVISATQLQAGDRVSVRVRAPRGSTLAQVEATPANHVAEHEPTSTGT